ncbi:MAG TPA: lysine/arginine/ornithine ABC transporter substrate-binding protein [Roseiarcus sp.]|nr:lysine/arginine/ornithine ABC transporter substrate-binding protein [Roseiarcus sp.]
MGSKFLKSVVVGASLAAALAAAPAAFAKDWKTVVIGMEGAYEPWNLTDSSGHIVGFEVDLANDLCKRINVECKIIAQDWDGMIPGLKAGKFDVIMDGMSITEERKKEIDFSKPYAAPPAAFMAAKGSDIAKALGPGKVVNATKDPAAKDAAVKAVQAALKGKTIGVQVSTTHANFASKYLKDIATIKEYKTTDERDLDLKSGRIDIALDDYPTIAAALDKPDAKDFGIVGPEFIGDVFGVGEGMGLRKSDADLTARFNKALDAAFADGSVKRYSLKWFKIDTTP